MKKKILAIETSCDETALAIVEAEGGLKSPRFKVLKSVVASQIKIHRPFGGVVPNLAKREHIKNLPILWKKMSEIKSEKLKVESLDLITVTVGPGLEPALWTGINFAKEIKSQISNLKNVPLAGANHLEGHLYSFLLPISGHRMSLETSAVQKLFPAIALIVSGGHTILLKLDSFSKWKKLGETRDDAVGEAFDKVARILTLPYPGGPEIEKLSMAGNPTAINFPRPMMNQKNYDFSFSGLKTAVFYYVRENGSLISADFTQNNAEKFPRESTSGQRKSTFTANIAASFQKAAIDVLKSKTSRAARAVNAKSIILCGGVAANKALRKALAEESKKLGVKFFVPDFKYNLDNAAMIAAAGYFAHLRGKRYRLEAQGNLSV